jgi:predicted transcriptional regulator
MKVKSYVKVLIHAELLTPLRNKSDKHNEGTVYLTTPKGVVVAAKISYVENMLGVNKQ